MAAGLIIPALMIWWVLDNIAKELRRIANALEASPPNPAPIRKGAEDA